jgi:hypothetical protein
VLPSPELVYPASEATDVNVGVAFTWQGVAGATSYHMQVASDPYFTSLVFEQGQLECQPTQHRQPSFVMYITTGELGRYMGEQAGPWSVPNQVPIIA